MVDAEADAEKKQQPHKSGTSKVLNRAIGNTEKQATAFWLEASLRPFPE